jgi:O-antigen/teichoic acid export membrane protein
VTCDLNLSPPESVLIAAPPASAVTLEKAVDLSAGRHARHFDAAHLRVDLKGRSIRGGAVTLLAQGVTFVLQLGSTAALARLLTPADFGLMAMVTALTGFVAMFKDAGLSMATVQRDQITQGQVSTLFWINVGLSTILMLIVAALAPVVVWFYGEPDLYWVTLAIASTFVISGLTVQHMALLKRQMRFAVLAAKDITAMAAGVAVAVTLAWLGAGYWALVAMGATSAVVSMVIIWSVTGWKPSLPRRGTGIRPMLAFGGNLTAFNFVNYFARNADNVLIGWYWGATTLGIYTKAYGLLLLPVRHLKGPLAAVAVPVLSRLQDDPVRYQNYYVTSINVMMWAVGPIVGLLAAVAPALVELVLGEQWTSAAPIFQVLALTAFLQPLYSSTGMIFTSYGSTDRMLRFGLFTAPLFTSSFAIGLPFGPIGVAVAYSITFLIAMPFLLAYTYHGTPVRLSAVGRALVWPSISSAVTFVTASGGAFWASASSPTVVLVTAGAATAVGILPLLLVRPLRAELKALMQYVQAVR